MDLGFTRPRLDRRFVQLSPDLVEEPGEDAERDRDDQCRHPGNRVELRDGWRDGHDRPDRAEHRAQHEEAVAEAQHQHRLRQPGVLAAHLVDLGRVGAQVEADTLPHDEVEDAACSEAEEGEVDGPGEKEIHEYSRTRGLVKAVARTKKYSLSR